MNTSVLALKFVWELPQNLLGAVVWLAVRRTVSETTLEHGRLFFHVPNFGVSLGSFVFWSSTDHAVIKINPDNKVHEFGHTIQSLYFGPLYLLVIGLPSISRVLYGTFHYALTKKKWQNYYAGYPERWADELGRKFY